jgi:UDP-N-acetylmuramoylalanine-D-glutamate ligase
VSLDLLMNNINKFLPKTGLVLLSPGGASFDEFANFSARGDFFMLRAKDAAK